MSLPLTLIGLLVVLAPLRAGATEAVYPAPFLVANSSLVVVATLSGVHEWRDGSLDRGEGALSADFIVFGAPVSKSSKLRLVWQNPADLACPRVDHRGDQGHRALWLLEGPAGDGSFRADSSGRVIHLDDQQAVSIFKQQLLKASESTARLEAVLNTLASAAAPGQSDAQLGAAPDGTRGGARLDPVAVPGRR